MNQSQNTYKSVTICIITNGGHVYFGCQMYTAHVQCESGQVKPKLALVSFDIGRIRLGGFVEHFKIVEHISYSTGTSRNFVEHKRCQ